MTAHELHVLETELYHRVRTAKMWLSEVGRCQEVIYNLAHNEGRINDLIEEVEVARHELPGVSAFKTPIRTSSVLNRIAKARATWRGAWEE